MSLVDSFKKLMRHLDSSRSSMAIELLEELKKADIEIDKLNCLEAGGVDNWDFYYDALRDNDWIGFEEEDEE